MITEPRRVRANQFPLGITQLGGPPSRSGLRIDRLKQVVILGPLQPGRHRPATSTSGRAVVSLGLSRRHNSSSLASRDSHLKIAGLSVNCL